MNIYEFWVDPHRRAKPILHSGNSAVIKIELILYFHATIRVTSIATSFVWHRTREAKHEELIKRRRTV